MTKNKLYYGDNLEVLHRYIQDESVDLGYLDPPFKGDIVLDPFCGCGTAIATAQKLQRSWTGIDITHLAGGLIKHRLRDTFGDDITQSYEVIGEPVSLPDVEVLGKDDPFQFQWWALGLVGDRPVEQKKGADKGIDGRLYFHDDVAGAKTKQIIFSVKAGRTSVPHVRDLLCVLYLFCFSLRFIQFNDEGLN